jgi:hypothetical protein
MPSGKLPPYPPSDPARLQRAVALTGRYANKQRLGWNDQLDYELKILVGAIPTSKQEAQRWKVGLRALRKEVLADPDPEDL